MLRSRGVRDGFLVRPLGSRRIARCPDLVRLGLAISSTAFRSVFSWRTAYASDPLAGCGGHRRSGNFRLIAVSSRTSLRKALTEFVNGRPGGASRLRTHRHGVRRSCRSLNGSSGWRNCAGISCGASRAAMLRHERLASRALVRRSCVDRRSAGPRRHDGARAYSPSAAKMGVLDLLQQIRRAPMPQSFAG